MKRFDVALQHPAGTPAHVPAVVVPVDVVFHHSEYGAGQLATGRDDLGGLAVGGDETGVGKGRQNLVDVLHVRRRLE